MKRARLAIACIASLLAPVIAHAEPETPAAAPASPPAAAAPASPPPAAAPASPPPAAAPVVKPATGKPIRSGLVLSLSLDSALGSTFGYPNDSKLLNDRRYYGRTGVLGGFGFTFGLSGALTEYLNVGFYLSSTGFATDVWNVGSGGFGMRFDVFPMTYARNKWLRHWAFYGLAGIGFVTAKYEDPARNVADLSGTQSNLGLGSFYEFRFGSIGIGPDSRFDAVFSRSTDRLAYQVGFRLSFYPSRLF